MYLATFQTPTTILVPADFQGLDKTREILRYHRSLPHFRQTGATYFATFRLADAIPKDVACEFQAFSAAWRVRLGMLGNPETTGADQKIRREYEENQRRMAIRMEALLDAGAGSCWMSQLRMREVVQNALLHFHPTRLHMYAFVVMPNHVHALFRPEGDHDPEDLAGSWKQFSSRSINRMTGQKGNLWQSESWDRIVRDSDHFRKVVRYIARNPSKANLSP